MKDNPFCNKFPQVPYTSSKLNLANQSINKKYSFVHIYFKDEEHAWATKYNTQLGDSHIDCENPKK